MNRIGSFSLILIVFFVFSCELKKKESLTKKTNAINEALVKMNVSPQSNNYQVVIIPSNSCTTCTSLAFKFLKKNYLNSNKFMFIITEITDLKTLHDQISDTIINSKTIVLDKNNEVGKSGFYSIYPQLISIENNVVTDYQQVDENQTYLWQENLK